MKTFYLTLSIVVLGTTVSAFVSPDAILRSSTLVPGTAAQAVKSKFKVSFLDGLLLPFHGNGSGKNKLGRIFQEEQDLLHERQLRYRKDQLKKKYSHTRAMTDNDQRMNSPRGNNWLENFLSHPFHMHGSGEHDYDDMFQAQQQVLYERRLYYGNKDMLRQKYKTPATAPQHKNHISDIPLHRFDPATLNKKEDNDMYNDEGIGKRRLFGMGW